MSGEIAVFIMAVFFIAMAILYLTPFYYFFVVISTFKHVQAPLKKSILFSLLLIIINITFYFNATLISTGELDVIKSNEPQFIFLGLLFFCLPFIYLHIVRKRNPKILGYWIAFILSFLAYNSYYFPQKMMGDKKERVIHFLQKGDLDALDKVWKGSCPDPYSIEVEFFYNTALIKTFDKKSLWFLTDCVKQNKKIKSIYLFYKTTNYPLFDNEFSIAEWNENVVDLFIDKEFYSTLTDEGKKELGNTIIQSFQGGFIYTGSFDDYAKKIDYILQQRPEFKNYIIFDQKEFIYALRNHQLKYAQYLKKYLDKNDPFIKLGFAIIEDDIKYVVDEGKKNPQLFTQILMDTSTLSTSGCDKGVMPFDINTFIFSNGSKDLILAVLDNNLVNTSDYKCNGYSYLADKLEKEKTCFSYLLRHLEYNYVIKDIDDKKEIEKRISSQLIQCDE
ncbi:hypothetical protein JEP40_14785 [Proteus vulgaris]|uniref:hypothetical protein n=1 Tax=Proteus vulgaris TaxID=585 RepID=UPI0018E44ECC|nr:hypothetical protein [Proteus vulgaris]MBI6530373.1 hypothetical protein [Proteus vulgaris]